MKIKVTRYPDTTDYWGYVEDDSKTWVLFLRPDGRPCAMFLERGDEGEVVGEPILFEDSEVPVLR